MKRKSLFLWGTALLLAAVGFDVTAGKDSPQTGAKAGASASEKGATKAGHRQ